MKKGKVFFNPVDGSAPLSITWSTESQGDAVEANNELGVGFFSGQGDLLGVIFDDVAEKKDEQTLDFDQYTVTVSTKRGIVSFDVHKKTSPNHSIKSKKAHRAGEAA